VWLSANSGSEHVSRRLTKAQPRTILLGWIFNFSIITFSRRKSWQTPPQAKKRARQAETRRTRNAGMRSMMRTHVKRVVAAIASGDKTAASEAYTAAVPVLDSMARKGLVHKNKAARYKSRLNAQIVAL